MFHNVRFIHLGDNGDKETSIKISFGNESPDEGYEL
jgi:hypothetical protein